MSNRLKRLFANQCPVCRAKLETSLDGIGWTKSCPAGHYREENYAALGVRIVAGRRK